MLRYSLAQIEECIENGRFGRALAHFCVVFKIQPSAKNDMKELFLLAVGKHTEQLEAEERWKELFDCYEELLKAYYSCEELHHSLGGLLFRHGHVKEAASSLRKALEINPNFTAARLSLDGLKTSVLERWHFRMLNDFDRNNAFCGAIAYAVRKGHKLVLDIGAGTGLLSLFAVSAGAVKVYACEVSPTSCEMARTVFAENNIAGLVRVINKHSTALTVPGDLDERVTLIVTETFDAGLFGEHVLKSLDHAWEHLLNKEVGQPMAVRNRQPRPTVIPEKAEVFACLIQSKWIRSGQRVSRAVLDGDLGLTDVELNVVCSDEDPYNSEKLSQVKHGFSRLCEPFHLLSVDFNNHQEIQDLIKGVQLNKSVRSTWPGILDAVCVWFRLKVGNTWLDTGPDSKTCWEQAIFNGPGARMPAGEVVNLAVSCKGHLTVRVLDPPPEDLPRRVTCLTADAIRAINGQAPAMTRVSRQLCASLRECCVQKNVLDLSNIPLLGLLLVRDQPNWKLTYVAATLDCTDFVACFVRSHRLECGVCKTVTLDELYCWQGQQYDIFIVNVFESTGLLRRGVFEDIALLRKSCLKPDVTMVPSSVTLRAVLVESEALEEQSYLVSNSRTGGYKIAETINAFQVQTQQEVCLATLPHRLLSDVFTLLEINLSNVGLDLPEISAVRSVPLLRAGRISGCCYWFEQECVEGITVSSYSPEDNTLQAAVVFQADVFGGTSTTVRVGASCVDSSINIWLDNVKDLNVQR